MQRSDGLYSDILYALERLQALLLTMFKTTGQELERYAADANQLMPRFASLRSICRIFYSLNYQDLPEYFENHMSEWMEEFVRTTCWGVGISCVPPYRSFIIFKMNSAKYFQLLDLLTLSLSTTRLIPTSGGR